MLLVGADLSTIGGAGRIGDEGSPDDSFGGDAGEFNEGECMKEG